ncbi:MAG: aldo/keto reductase [Gemmatimonadota bacterium]|nr:aldo/keto reductase [Gemmatimonadota bacterium]
MKVRPLGDSGLRVPRIGLGLAALGRPGYINLGHAADLNGDREVDALRERTHAVLDAAWEGGVRYFDAARSYGRAEEFLAGWLRRREISAEQAVVGSKWGYTYTAGWRVQAETHEVKEHSPERFRSQRAESDALLGAHLKLYQIHSATRTSGVLENRAVHAALAELRADGVRVGLSLSGAEQGETLRHAIEIQWEGERLFDVVQATWNLLERSAGPALAEAHAAGMGTIVKEALANGRLTARNREPGFAERATLLLQEAERLGTGVDALALAAVLAQPWADVVLSGAATTGQLRSNLTAVPVAWDTRAAELLSTLAEPAAGYWETRSALPWN